MTTEARLAALEKELSFVKRNNRRLYAVILAISVLGVGVAATYPGNGNTLANVRSQQFTLVDEKGGVCAVLKTGGAGPSLALYGDNHKLRVLLGGVNKSAGPGLRLYDEEGRNRTDLCFDKNGPRLCLLDENNIVRAQVCVDADGPSVGMCDGKGKVRAAFGSTKDKANMRVSDENGNCVAGLAVDKAGSMMYLQDEDGKLRVQIGAPKAAPFMVLLNKNGDSIGHVP